MTEQSQPLEGQSKKFFNPSYRCIKKILSHLEDVKYEYGFVLKFSCATRNQAQKTPHSFTWTLSNSDGKQEVKLNQRKRNTLRQIPNMNQSKVTSSYLL